MNWAPQDSELLYNIPNWGRGYFGVNAAGHIEVTPDGPEGTRVDLYDLVQQILARGVSAPILLRFDGILRSRVRQINEAFRLARQEAEYQAPYRGVYPIKVNQERHVVEALLGEGREHGMGLEVGSKPELLAGIALQAGEGSLMICNGYKDEEYVEMALNASRLGITAILVIEKMTELQVILDASRRLGIEPAIGVRSKLSIRGSGRWKHSVGDRSKFGLTTREIVAVVEQLKAEGRVECLQLLHFHIGSQISHISSIKQAMREATNLLVGLHRMGAHVKWFDAGGGLGVDYDGSSTNFDSSMNYSLSEYASDIVCSLKAACEEAEVPEPIIVTESGRALVAHHAVLVGEVVGRTSPQSGTPPIADAVEDPDVVLRLREVCDEVTVKNYQESYHDALHLRDEVMLLFNTGGLSLPDRARAEELFFKINEKILKVTQGLEYVPDELENLQRDLADTYFINFSVFQSIPDAWAIHQLFPVMPVHRLGERPTRHVVLADLTCDSDGKVDRFIDLRDVKRTLELHDPKDDERYWIAFFLVGAYQEILGDMHNLFGDTNIVHVDVDAQGRPKLVHVLGGDRVKDVLGYVEYVEKDLLTSLRGHVEHALAANRMSYEESAHFLRRYETALRGSTYLTRRELDEPARSNTRGVGRADPTEVTR